MATFAEQQAAAEDKIRRELIGIMVEAEDIDRIMKWVGQATTAAGQFGYDAGYRSGRDDAYWTENEDID